MSSLSEVMASLPASKSTTDQNQTSGAQPDVFPFFRLPRELRDNIYAAVPLECKKTVNGHMSNAARCNLRVVAKTLKVNLLLVSKQFRQEYTKEMQIRTSLSIHDNHLHSHAREWQLPRVLKAISNVEMSLMLAVYYIFPELAGKNAWLANALSQLPNMAALKVRGRLSRIDWLGREETIEQLGLAFNQEFWLSFPRLVDIKMYHVPASTLDIDYDDPKWCESMLLELMSQDEQVVTLEQQGLSEL